MPTPVAHNASHHLMASFVYLRLGSDTVSVARGGTIPSAGRRGLAILARGGGRGGRGYEQG